MGRNRKVDWRDAAWWFGFTLAGFFAPGFIGGFVAWAVGTNLNIDWFAGDGQFAFASAGLLMTTCYFVTRPSGVFRMWHARWFLFTSLLALLVVICFVVLATLDKSDIAVKPQSFRWPSVIFFAIALVMAFVAVALDNTQKITVMLNNRREVVVVEDNAGETEAPGSLENRYQAYRDQLDQDFDATSEQGGQV